MRLLFLSLAAALATACGRPPFADVVFTGGTVMTMDSTAPAAEAVAVRDGRIVYVGPEAGAQPWIGTRTVVVPLAGRTLLPGFVDAHIHPVSSGVELAGCDLAEDETREALEGHVRRCAAALPDSAWLVGSNWALPLFPEANPRREWLDSLAPGRPAYLSAADGHSGWASTEALRLAGVTKDTPDPVNGRIERDARGEPTGTLRESAMALVTAVIPPVTAEQRVEGLRRSQQLLHAAGVTALQEAAATRPLLEAYRTLDRSGELTLRSVSSLLARPEEELGQVDTLMAWRNEFRGSRVYPTSVKIFADGVIEAHTAAMLAPYTGREEAGTPNWREGQLDSIIARLVDRDFSVHVHAIGDRAVRMTLDAMEKAEQGRPRGTRRHQIAHLEVIDSADIGRFAALDVTANFQALWAYPDTYITDLTWPVLGPDRSRWLYPIGSVVRAGGRLALGSDWNVSSYIPMEAIQVAVTRRNPRDTTGTTEPLLAEQAIDLETALRGYTIGSAYAVGLDREVGSITVGKAADLVVLGEDLRIVSPTRLARIPVLLTMVAGTPVHGELGALVPVEAP
ncbi:MAG TPA: amidohydrolase [Gemmatimonadales bacterium]|nr:amidohydrolase [Gemmatimonadales bacterium]